MNNINPNRVERHKNYLESLEIPENVVMKLDYDDLDVQILKQNEIIEARMQWFPPGIGSSDVNLFDIPEKIQVIYFSARGTRLLNLMENLESQLRNSVDAYWSV